MAINEDCFDQGLRISGGLVEVPTAVLAIAITAVIHFHTIQLQQQHHHRFSFSATVLTPTTTTTVVVVIAGSKLLKCPMIEVDQTVKTPVSWRQQLNHSRPRLTRSGCLRCQGSFYRPNKTNK